MPPYNFSDAAARAIKEGLGTLNAQQTEAGHVFFFPTKDQDIVIPLSRPFNMVIFALRLTQVDYAKNLFIYKARTDTNRGTDGSFHWKPFVNPDFYPTAITLKDYLTNLCRELLKENPSAEEVDAINMLLSYLNNGVVPELLP